VNRDSEEEKEEEEEEKGKERKGAPSMAVVWLT
jgi:purine-cytosine permease-like protein